MPLAKGKKKDELSKYIVLCLRKFNFKSKREGVRKGQTDYNLERKG